MIFEFIFFADLLFKSKFAKKKHTNMIHRTITEKLQSLLDKYPIVTLTGPRQSGKSTLLRETFKNYQYVSLEDPDVRGFAMDDPRGFLKTYSDKTIIDEAQKVPSLFSYIQSYTDVEGKTGMYILAGSQNFLLLEAVSQSLAGRTAILRLLPFSAEEMAGGGIVLPNVDSQIFYGSYPRLFDKEIHPNDFYPYYIQTYVERDVRQIKNIGDINKFQKFVKLCAGRIGQVLNVSSLANDCGISVSAANSWLSILESSYICFLLKPDYNNFSKRLIKSPKLYFYDTGLACSLLDIKSEGQLSMHYLRGGLFENFVIAEFLKHYFNQGNSPDLTYFRDSTGNEIDLIDNVNGKQLAYEIKVGSTFSPDYFKGIIKWLKYSNYPSDNCTVVYTGDREMQTSNGRVANYRNIWKR